MNNFYLLNNKIMREKILFFTKPKVYINYDFYSFRFCLSAINVFSCKKCVSLLFEPGVTTETHPLVTWAEKPLSEEVIAQIATLRRQIAICK